MIHVVSTADLLILDDEFDTVYKVGTWDDVIQLSDYIYSHRYAVSFVDRVMFADSITFNGGAVHRRTLSDTVVFVDEFHPRRHIKSISDQMVLIDWFDAPTIRELYDTLVFVEGLTAWAGRAALDTLTLVDSCNHTLRKASVLSDSLTLRDGFTGYVNNPWTPIYPIVGETP